ncbi:MAG: DUF1456 family protein [Bacteroidia bacterium]|nr:DUF1456 family protein [Bacteroidia bacterium]
MNNNDILRRLRYTFEFSDSDMMELFAEGGKLATRAQISDWLKKDTDEAFQLISDEDLAFFLTGWIAKNRGKKDGEIPVSEKKLDNNIIFRKIKIALSLKNEDIQEILKLVDFRISEHEISAFFRSADHRKYRICQDQILRNFIHGLQLKYHP